MCGAQVLPEKGVAVSIAAAVEAGPPEVARPVGKIDAWLSSLPESEREAADRILRDPEWQHEQVRALFIEHGLDVSPQSLGTYRRNLRRDAR